MNTYYEILEKTLFQLFQKFNCLTSLEFDCFSSNVQFGSILRCLSLLNQLIDLSIILEGDDEDEELNEPNLFLRPFDYQLTSVRVLRLSLYKFRSHTDLQNLFPSLPYNFPNVCRLWIDYWSLSCTACGTNTKNCIKGLIEPLLPQFRMLQDGRVKSKYRKAGGICSWTFEELKN